MKNYLTKIIVSVVFLGVISWLALFYGGISLQGLSPEYIKQILDLRFQRIVLAGLAGAGLALCGLSYQATLLNPLAEPYLLGVSSGGALGAILALLQGWDVFPMALIGALSALFIVFSLAFKRGRLENNSLILSGVMINAFASALIMLLVILGGSKTNSMLFWLMGDIGSGSDYGLIVAGIFILTVITAVFARALDALSLGEEQACYLGINARDLKLVVFILASFVTSLIVANVGIIGFVGLVIPHIAKLLVGEHFAPALPITLIIGAGFLIAADLLSRIIIPGIVLPVGVITALLGVPFFAFIYKKN